MEKEIVFVKEESQDGGWISRALGHSIFTEADSIEDLKINIKEAINCHFEEDSIPKIIRLHYVKDEFLTV